MATSERPSTDLNWYVDRLRNLSATVRVEQSAVALFSEEVSYDTRGLPCALGTLAKLDEFRPRFAELLARHWDWINLHALGLLNGDLIISVECPSTPGGNSPFTSVNLSGPTRAVADRNFDLESFLVVP